MPIGAQKANLSQEVQAHMEEVALNEQGHALFTRQVCGNNACRTAASLDGIQVSMHGNRVLPQSTYGAE